MQRFIKVRSGGVADGVGWGGGGGGVQEISVK